jgi:hypothetical protein
MDYHLKPVGRTCTATGEVLAPGSTCYSVVVDQRGQLVRMDYSADGWTGPPEGAIAHWRSQVPEADDSKPKPIDPDALLHYFEQLCEDANPAQEKFAYVISLLLLQKRRLRIDGSRRDGDIEYLRFLGSHGEGPFEVRDQRLAEEEIVSLQNELNTHLSGVWS